MPTTKPAPAKDPNAARARAVEMLGLAADYIRDNAAVSVTVFYDGADCDGLCVAMDCDNAAEHLKDDARRERIAQSAPELFQALQFAVSRPLTKSGRAKLRRFLVDIERGSE